MSSELDKVEWLYNPNAEPAKELSKHDQDMIRLGWEAHRKLPLSEPSLLDGKPSTFQLNKHFGWNALRWWKSLPTDEKEYVNLLVSSRAKAQHRTDKRFYTGDS